MIYCCACGKEVVARLTDGQEIYPNRPDLHGLPYWICDTCRNYVGCHHKTSNPTTPLGNIPTQELRRARWYIHKILDPLWKSGKIKRAKLYALVSEKLGVKAYHTASVNDIDYARKVYRVVQSITREISQ